MRTSSVVGWALGSLLVASSWACGSHATSGGTMGTSSGASASSGVGGSIAGSSSASASSASASSSGSGSGGGSGGTGGGGAIDPNAFYVATDGDDDNAGTLSAPFATFAHAQTAMQGSSTIKTTYVRAGTYAPPATGGNCVWGNAAGSSIALSSADDGETWSYYPPDGFGSAILDGQSTVGDSGGSGGNGVGCAFGAAQVSNVTITGLAFQRYLYAGIWAWAATGAVVSNNVVHDTTAAAFSTAGIYLVASPGAVIANNYVHDVAYMGIAVTDNSSSADALSNSTVANNVVLNACTWPAVMGAGNDQNGGDCGAIYLWSQHPSTSTNVKVTNNYVRDVNPASMGQGDYGGCCDVGVYLDDGTNNVTVSGNVVTGVTSACFQIHGGQDNVIEGNLCDLGSSGAEPIVYYQDDGLTQMMGNVFEHNVVVAGSSGGGAGFDGSNSPPNPMTIANNAYFNYVGTKVSSSSQGGAGSDASPRYVDPQISCWAPRVQGGSPVLAAPTGFPGIQGGWGYPGLVMPMTGTAPSWPHGC